MGHRKIRIAIVSITALVSLRLFVVANDTALWREFVVSELQLIVAAFALWFLIARRTE